MNKDNNVQNVIIPTVGRVIWYHPHNRGRDENLRHAATVAFVNEDGTVNLSIVDCLGQTYVQRNVVLVQDQDKPAMGQAEWMPYQKSQAVKNGDTVEIATPVADSVESEVVSAELEQGTEPTQEEIAQMCHIANSAYSESIGEAPSALWDNLTADQKASLMVNVQMVIDNPEVSGEAMHNSWGTTMAKAGWKYGEVKDEAAKTHPYMLAYSDMTDEKRARDNLFIKTVLLATNPITK